MKISYNWLKDYLTLEKEAKDIAEDLSNFGFTVESLENIDGDYVFDLEINPNRGDCLSILGIARELAALYDQEIKMPEVNIEADKIDKTVEVKITDPKICPRYCARIVDNIEIKSSPEWLQKRLAIHGFRPINNIVDITNYVMIATGQPMHAFDWSKIKDGLMELGLSKEGDELITLDGKNHQLGNGTIVIRDREKIFDLAGIMGGYSSEVDNQTKTIVLQSAVFAPELIRRASKNLAHVTDASYRYERGIDIGGTDSALELATTLIKESCNDVKVGELIDLKDNIQETKIDINYNKINSLLGTKLSEDEMKKDLERLNFKITSDEAIVPSYRAYDVKIWQDLAEEIARIFGYKNIESSGFENQETEIENHEWLKIEWIKDIFKKAGFCETYASSFVSENEIKLFGLDPSQCREIANPIIKDVSYLRPSTKITLVSQASKNPWAPDIALFEIGTVFYEGKEFWQIGAVAHGTFENKLKDILLKLGVKNNPEQIDQKILDYYKVRRSLKAVELTLDKVKIDEEKFEKVTLNTNFKELSKYPPTVRDIALICDKNIDSREIKKVITELSENIFLVELFDEFTSDKFGKDKKNLAYHIWLSDNNKSMSEEESEEIIKRVIAEVEAKFKVKLRS